MVGWDCKMLQITHTNHFPCFPALFWIPWCDRWLSEDRSCLGWSVRFWPIRYSICWIWCRHNCQVRSYFILLFVTWRVVISWSKSTLEDNVAKQFSNSFSWFSQPIPTNLLMLSCIWLFFLLFLSGHGVCMCVSMHLIVSILTSDCKVHVNMITQELQPG